MTPADTTSNLIGQRLKAEMKKRGITSADLAKRSDVKTSFLYDIMSGKSANPSTVKLARVAENLGISLAYLAGSTDNQQAETPLSSRNMPDDYVIIPRILVDISAGNNSIVSIEQEGESYYFRKDWIREHLKADPAELRMLYVRGDSMEPTLCHNDMVLLDTNKKIPSPPGIFVLYDGFGLVVKRLEHLTQANPPRVRIISDNPQYSVYERSIAETLIIGRVVWFAREI